MLHRGFDRNPENDQHEVHCRVPKLTIKGNYKVNGRVLVLPIQGDGKATIVLTNVDIDMKIKFKTIVKKGQEYIQIDAFKLIFDAENMKIQLTNLFNGNQALADSMLQVLNENWRDLLQELRPAITFAFEEIVKSIANRIFNKVPYYELFLKDEN